VWADLSAGDVAAEVDFYSALFGWEYEPSHPDASGWRQAAVEGKAAAGIQVRPAQMPISAWTVFFAAQDIDAAVAQAVELGATVYAPPMRVEIGGEFKCAIAVLADPTGAVFGLTQSGQHTGFGIREGRGSAAWFELMSRGCDRALEFYQALLGAQSRLAPGSPMAYNLLSVDGVDFGGAMEMPDMVPATAPSYWSVYFAVDDADEAVRVAQDKGATLLMGPETMSAGRIACLMDPEHAMVNVIELPREPLA
jgi:predicted enzyme related to lactoylglutathione lyase